MPSWSRDAAHTNAGHVELRLVPLGRGNRPRILAPPFPARSSQSVGYGLGPKASAIRVSNSFLTSVFGSGLSTGKCSEPLVLVFVYASVSLASCG